MGVQTYCMSPVVCVRTMMPDTEPSQKFMCLIYL